MPTASYPGVHVQEIPSGTRTIAGVDTSTALFIGWAARGPLDEAIRVKSFADFASTYGGLDARSLLGYSLTHFFDNGGHDAYVLRVAHAGDDGLVLDPAGPNAADFNSAVRASVGAGSVTDRIDLYNLVCVPGLADGATVAAVQQECRRRRAFMILDCERAATVAAPLSAAFGAAITGANALNSALYFPWVRAPDPQAGGALREFPPCRFVAGLCARIDAARGVWKAPAGQEASLVGASGLTVALTDGENGVLNPRAVNCLRTFPVYGTVAWGARTLHGDDARGSEWKYVNVRRLALYLEESIYRGTQWAVFEPNGEPLWAQLRLHVGALLSGLWRQGAFQGATEKEAFFVHCGADTTTPADVNLGVVNVEVGFAPLKPAEFIVIRFQQKAGS